MLGRIILGESVRRLLPTVQHNVDAGIVQERLRHLADAVCLAEVGGVGVVLRTQQPMHAGE